MGKTECVNWHEETRMNSLLKAWDATPELLKPLIALALLGLLCLTAFFFGQLIGLMLY